MVRTNFVIFVVTEPTLNSCNWAWIWILAWTCGYYTYRINKNNNPSWTLSLSLSAGCASRCLDVPLKMGAAELEAEACRGTKSQRVTPSTRLTRLPHRPSPVRLLPATLLFRPLHAPCVRSASLSASVSKARCRLVSLDRSGSSSAASRGGGSAGTGAPGICLVEPREVERPYRTP